MIKSQMDFPYWDARPNKLHRLEFDYWSLIDFKFQQPKVKSQMDFRYWDARPDKLHYLEFDY